MLPYFLWASLLIFWLGKIDGNDILGWTSKHQWCRIHIPDVSDSIVSSGIFCNNQPYFQYFLALRSNPQTKWQKDIAEAVINLYNDLDESISKRTSHIQDTGFIEATFPLFTDSQRKRRKQQEVMKSEDSTIPIEEGGSLEVTIHPVSFSIPGELIASQVPAKEKSFCRVIPGNRSTYFGHNEEHEYYEDIRQSLFAFTYKKAGWDCMRHYEILALGCLPLFLDIGNLQSFYDEDSSRTALAFHPIKLYKTLLQYPGLILSFDAERVNSGVWNPEVRAFAYDSSFNAQLYSALVMATLQYARNVFSSTAMANYLLKTVQSTCRQQNKTLGSHESGQIRSVLYITNHCYDITGDYLVDTMLHGLKKLLGENTRVVINHTRRIAMTRTMEDFNRSAMAERKKGLYGHGMTFGMKLDSLAPNPQQGFDQAESDVSLVVRMIENHEFDLIIYASTHRIYHYNPVIDPAFMELWGAVCAHYGRHEVVLMDGSDHRLHAQVLDPLLVCASHVFSREGIAWEKIHMN